MRRRRSLKQGMAVTALMAGLLLAIGSLRHHAAGGADASSESHPRCGAWSLCHYFRKCASGSAFIF